MTEEPIVTRIVTIAAIGLAAGLCLSLGGCAGTPMEPRPIAGRAQSVPVEQAKAECDFEGTKAITGIQNLGLASYTYREVYGSCMKAAGYEMVEVGAN
jgi:hypothetical protein